MGTKNYYNTILSQVISPCGDYLIVGDIYGTISVFNLQKIMNPENEGSYQDRKPKNTFVVEPNVQINSLLTTDHYLIVGVVGEIIGYNLAHVTGSKDVKQMWRIVIPNSKDTFEKADINCLIYDNTNEILYAAASDNILTINIETGKIINTLSAHSNFIHSMVKMGNNILTGGEDGLVNIWDVRQKNVVHKLEPHKNVKLHRPDLGKWIGAVALNEDWLLCGGGPRLSLWHYRSLNVSTVFPLDDKGIHVAEFYQDKILAGGHSKTFFQINLNGDIVSEIPTSSVTIYSAAHQDEPYKALCLGGSSANIDICSNFNYRDQVLTLNIY